MDECRNHESGRYADWHIDVKVPAPVEIIGDITPDGQSMIGATIRPNPHTAIASVCSLGGKVSIRIACESGCKAAPAIPCKKRKATI